MVHIRYLRHQTHLVRRLGLVRTAQREAVDPQRRGQVNLVVLGGVYSVSGGREVSVEDALGGGDEIHAGDGGRTRYHGRCPRAALGVEQRWRDAGKREWGGRPGWKTFGGGCARSDVCAVGHHAWRRGRVGAGTRRGSFWVQISFLLLLLLLLVADHGEVGLVLFVHVSRAVRAPLGAKATPAR